MSDQRNMFYGATPMIFERAKILRKNLTSSEKMLWEKLRSNKLLGLRFRNEEVENNLQTVLEKIKSECNHALSPLEGVGGKNNSNE